MVAVPARAAPALTLKWVKVESPDSHTMFQGPGADAINQPALPRAVWRATVEKMIHAYMAPVDRSNAAAIVDYLTRTKGVQ
jgi:hypothetical protein